MDRRAAIMSVFLLFVAGAFAYQGDLVSVERTLLSIAIIVALA